MKARKATPNRRRQMTPRELRRLLSTLDAGGAVADSLETALAGPAPRDTWYRTQKEHLLGWLDEYDGPGFYGRSDWKRSAEFIFNHFQCAPGLLWIAEAAGAPYALLVKARRAAIAAPKNGAAQSAAVRAILPWVWVEALLARRA
jgi:hypothetical protein